MVDSCLIDLEEMIDPPLVSLPFITPSLSSTPRDTTKGALHLLSSPLPIAQCTGLEMGESLRGDSICVEVDLLDSSSDIIVRAFF